MLRLVLLTGVYLVASVLIGRYLDKMGVARNLGRGLVVFIFSVTVAYGMASIVELVAA
jgi:hypothetical protein